MTQNLTENLIDLSYRGFSSNRATELHLNHGEDRLDIRPFVIMLQKGFPIEVVEVPHSMPKPIKLFTSLATFGIAFEGDIWCSIYCLNRMETITARVSFVSRYFADIECLGSSIDQLGELGSIGCFSRGDFNASNYMSFNTTNQMGFYPLRFAPNPPHLWSNHLL